MARYIESTSISGLFVCKLKSFADDRGSFSEVVHLNELKDVTGVDFSMRQVNHSVSKSGVLRGLHGEYWNKLVYPVAGAAFIAIADIRPESPTFGQHESFTIDNLNRFALFVSKGLANSLLVTGQEDLNYLYWVDEYYDPKKPGNISVLWNDPDLNIPWPVLYPILSQRDLTNPTMRELFPDKYA